MVPYCTDLFRKKCIELNEFARQNFQEWKTNAIFQKYSSIILFKLKYVALIKENSVSVPHRIYF